MRWTDTCELISKTYVTDDEGVQHEVTTKREVFCNTYSLGTQSWTSARLADYSADAEIQLRSCDYDDETDLILHGNPYSVEHPMVHGDYTRLTLRKNLSDEVSE